MDPLDYDRCEHCGLFSCKDPHCGDGPCCEHCKLYGVGLNIICDTCLQKYTVENERLKAYLKKIEDAQITFEMNKALLDQVCKLCEEVEVAFRAGFDACWNSLDIRYPEVVPTYAEYKKEN